MSASGAGAFGEDRLPGTKGSAVDEVGQGRTRGGRVYVSINHGADLTCPPLVRGQWRRAIGPLRAF